MQCLAQDLLGCLVHTVHWRSEMSPCSLSIMSKTLKGLKSIWSSLELWFWYMQRYKWLWFLLLVSVRIFPEVFFALKGVTLNKELLWLVGWESKFIGNGSRVWKNINGATCSLGHFLVLRWLPGVWQLCWSPLRMDSSQPLLTLPRVMVATFSKMYKLPFLFMQLILRGSSGVHWVQRPPHCRGHDLSPYRILNIRPLLMVQYQ